MIMPRPQAVFIKVLRKDSKFSGDRMPRSYNRFADLESMQSSSPSPKAHSVPSLHPVYLPFKTQHRILVPVQSLLEECCFAFGNVWVPDVMEARKWYDAESIELTQWTTRVAKHTKSLPSSAIHSPTNKSITEVLFGTSKLRHTAVHRLRTSASGILRMLNSAIIFAETLNDSERAEKVKEIKVQLEVIIGDIVQHQNLLQRKLTDQLEDIARRRAELDELEKVSIREMLEADERQRAEVGSSMERFLSNAYARNPNSGVDTANMSSIAEGKDESSELGKFHLLFLFLVALLFA